MLTKFNNFTIMLVSGGTIGARGPPVWHVLHSKECKVQGPNQSKTDCRYFLIACSVFFPLESRGKHIVQILFFFFSFYLCLSWNWVWTNTIFFSQLLLLWFSSLLCLFLSPLSLLFLSLLLVLWVQIGCSKWCCWRQVDTTPFQTRLSRWRWRCE